MRTACDRNQVIGIRKSPRLPDMPVGKKRGDFPETTLPFNSAQYNLRGLIFTDKSHL